MKRHFFLPQYVCGTRCDKLPIEPDKPWLAPLAGYSDLPFRLLCREYGAAVCETEMVSAKGLLYKSPGTGDLLKNTSADHPLVVQLFGSSPSDLGEAVTTLGRNGYRWFDCNFGCSVPKVMRQGAGAALLQDEDRCLDIASAMLNATKKMEDTAGAGFKMRLGIEAGKPVLPDLALRLEDLGAAWICVHPRWARQGFAGEADWKVLEMLAKRLSIPLIASGDLIEAEDGIKCMRQTGVHGLMYARGALRNPAIFSDHLALLAGEKPSVMTKKDMANMIIRHMQLISQSCTHEETIFRMRFIVPRYVRNSPHARVIRQRLCDCSGWEGFENILEEFFLSGGN